MARGVVTIAIEAPRLSVQTLNDWAERQTAALCKGTDVKAAVVNVTLQEADRPG